MHRIHEPILSVAKRSHLDLKYGPIWFQKTKVGILQISPVRRVSSIVSLNITAAIEIMKKQAAIVN